MPNPFGDDTLAAGYAAARPAVHPQVIALARRWLDNARVRTAADLGCGAGLSTRPLLDVADTCIGVDPAEQMVRVARRTVPHAWFAVGDAAAIPLRSGSVDLLTAAGSLNYVQDLDAAWPEAARVLSRHGRMAVYDFSTGRAFADDTRLDGWFEAFLERYPRPAGQARPLSPDILHDVAAGFTIGRAETFAMPLRMSPAFYTNYLLTESNVQDAVRRGTPLESIRAWCDTTVPAIFGGRDREVVFGGYLAMLSLR